ncbi:phage holin [Alkalimonas sp. NCh-2]|uniref:phage holin n=1 Tax=Alkalimonas sp. NCh-2 TaxID=3144846 RepID=UPI0031F63E9B
MDKTTSTVSYVTSGTVGIGGLALSEWVMVIAAVFFAALTFAVNWWYQHRREKREFDHLLALAKLDAEFKAAQDLRDHEHHMARMERIKNGSTEPYSGLDDAGKLNEQGNDER